MFKHVPFTISVTIQQISVFKLAHQDPLLITKQENVSRNALKIKEFMETHFFMSVPLLAQEVCSEVKLIKSV